MVKEFPKSTGIRFPNDQERHFKCTLSGEHRFPRTPAHMEAEITILPPEGQAWDFDTTYEVLYEIGAKYLRTI